MQVMLDTTSKRRLVLGGCLGESWWVEMPPIGRRCTTQHASHIVLHITDNWKSGMLLAGKRDRESWEYDAAEASMAGI